MADRVIRASWADNPHKRCNLSQSGGHGGPPRGLSHLVKFGVAGEPLTPKAGTVIALEKAIPHDLQALEDSELLLTIVKKVK